MESGLPLECNQINLTFVLGEILYQFICELLLGSYQIGIRALFWDNGNEKG